MKKLVIIYYHDIVEKGKGYSYQKVEKAHFESQYIFTYKIYRRTRSAFYDMDNVKEFVRFR